MVEILLQQLGFSQKEIEIYLFLLKNGAASPTKISRETKVKRSTVYVVVNELLKKGIIKEDLTTTIKTLVPLPPSVLQNLYKTDEKDLELKKRKINTAMSELEKIAKEKIYTIPKIVFIPEEEIEDYMKKRADEWDKSMLKYDCVWWGFEDKTFVEKFLDWTQWYWNRPSKKIKVKLLGNSNQIEMEILKKYKGEKMRYYDKNHQFTSTIWILGDYVVILQTKNSPMYLFEIADKELAYNLRVLFKNIWNEEK